MVCARRHPKPQWFCGFALIVALLWAGAAPGLAAPGDDSPPVQVQARLSHRTIHAGQSFRIAVTARIKPGFHINAHQPSEEFLVPTTVALAETPAVIFGNVVYPEPRLQSLSFSRGKLALYQGNVSFFARGTVRQNVVAGPLTVSGVLKFQACDDRACLMPKQVTFSAPIEVVDKTQPVVLNTSQVFQQAETLSGQEKQAESLIQRGLFYATAAFFVFGLALNLTPCVYPVIPMTVAFFSTQGGLKKRKTFVLGLYYVLGIAVVFSILGLISGLAGKQWGFLFQNPWFVIAITLIILALAASMFGAFQIRMPTALMQIGGKSRAGATGALAMGLTVGAVIAPCAAGIIVGLIGLVARSGLVVKGTLLFFVMGLGLGMPYLLLAVFSGLLSRLPKSGMWMVWVRKLLGFVLIGVALSFLVPQGAQASDQQGFYLGVLVAFAGIFLGFLDSAEGLGKRFKTIRAIFGVLLILAGGFFVHQALRAQTTPIDWISYTGQSPEALCRDNKPVLIDFYADWCAACKALDRKTFSDARVAGLAKDFVMVRVDLSRHNPAGEALRTRFRVTGLPTVVIARADGTPIQALRTVGFVGPSDMAKRMQAALADRAVGTSEMD